MPEDSEAFVGVDAVIHLVGIAHIRADDAMYREVNINLARRMAALAAKASVKRFIFASSIHVHGRWSVSPISPASPMHPVTAGGRSKMEAEFHLMNDLGGSDTQLAIVRLPLVYGPRAPANFGQLLRAAAMGLPLPLGSATGVRSIVSLANASDAFVHLALRGHTTGSPRILIPADGEDLQVRELYRCLCLAAGHKTSPIPVNLSIVKGLLAVLGRAETYESLFLPAVVDRRHWEPIGWSPPEKVRAALGAAMGQQMPETESGA
jgi:UDP-glucose 4-epimerase